MPEETAPHKQSNSSRLDELEAKLIQIQIDNLNQSNTDHEKRLRALEDTATKFNFILYLTMGGGFVSLINLFAMMVLLVNTLKP